MINNDVTISSAFPPSAPSLEPASLLPRPTTPSLETAPPLIDRYVTQEALPTIDELLWADRLEEAAERLKEANTPQDLCLLGSIYTFLGRYEAASQVLLKSIRAQDENLEAWYWFFFVARHEFTFSLEGQALMQAARVELYETYGGPVCRKNLGFSFWKSIYCSLNFKDTPLRSFAQTEPMETILNFAETPAEKNVLNCFYRRPPVPYASFPHLLGRLNLIDFLTNPQDLLEFLLRQHALNPSDTFPLMGLCLNYNLNQKERLEWLEKLNDANASSLIVDLLSKIIEGKTHYELLAIPIISCKSDMDIMFHNTNISYFNQFDCKSDQLILFRFIQLWQRDDPNSSKLKLVKAWLMSEWGCAECEKLFETIIPELEKEKDPNLGYALFLYGNYLMKKVQNDKGASYLLQALRHLTNPIQQAWAEEQLSIYYINKFDWENGRKFANNACHHAPKNANNFYWLGFCYLQLESYQEAEKWLLRAGKLLSSKNKVLKKSLYEALAFCSIKLKNQQQADLFMRENRGVTRLEAYYEVSFGDKKKGMALIKDHLKRTYRDLPLFSDFKNPDFTLYIDLLLEYLDYEEVKISLKEFDFRKENGIKFLEKALLAAYHLQDCQWLSELGQVKIPGAEKLSLMPFARAEHFFKRGDVKLAINLLSQIAEKDPLLNKRLQEFREALPESAPVAVPQFLSTTLKVEKEEGYKILQREEQLKRKKAKKQVEFKPKASKKEKKERAIVKAAASYSSTIAEAASAAVVVTQPQVLVPPSPSPSPHVEIRRGAPLIARCFLHARNCQFTDRDKHLLRLAKMNFVALRDTMGRKEIDEEVRLMALLHYKFQLCEALRHVTGFSEIKALRHAIRHHSAQITLKVLSQHIEEMLSSDLSSILDDLLAGKACNTRCSLSKYEERSELETKELWTAFKDRIALLPAIHQQLSQLVKESGRLEIEMHDMLLEGDITASLKGVYIVLGEMAARLNERGVVPKSLAQDPLFKKLIERGNYLAHEEAHTEISPVPENHLLELLLHGHKLNIS